MGNYYVIVTSRNSERTIEKAILSLHNQTIKPEYIITIDDGSTDSTPDILNRSKDLVRVIEWINENITENSVVIGSIHWRGWFSLFLNPSNDYKYEENVVNITNLKNNSLFKTYSSGLCDINTSGQDSKWSTIILVSNSEKVIKSLWTFQIYGLGQFNVFDISKILCKH